uniref:Nucleocapsid protein n=1 Tax=Cryptotermes secundus lispivirus 1 TaxID=3133545 RepID=A0AAT9JN77_9MONO
MSLVNIDGLLLHPAAGSLALLDAAQAFPPSAITIDPLVPTCPTVQIGCPTGLTRDSEYSVAILWSLRHFYPDAGIIPSSRELIGGLISYINCLLPSDMVEGQGQLTEALMYANIDPQWRIITKGNYREFATHDALKVFRMFSHQGRELFTHERSQQLGLLGLILLLIGKSVTTAGYEGWVNNRLRTFRGVLGIQEDEFIWVLRTSPPQRVLASLSTFLSANQPLRTRLFHVCLRAAASKINLTTQIFSTVLRLLRGVEMNHLLLIDYYVITKYPEILRIRVVRDNMARFNLAIGFLSTIPEAERMYVKILRPRVDTAVLNRNNFSMLANAAFSAAKYENPSMKNYRGGQEASAGGHVDKVVTTYLTIRTTLSIKSMLNSPHSLTTEDERMMIEAEAYASSRGIPLAFGISADPEKQGQLPPMRAPAQQANVSQQATPTRP